jgi:hypothetical protein
MWLTRVSVRLGIPEGRQEASAWHVASEVCVKVSNESLRSSARMFTPASTWLEIPQGRQVTMFLAYSEVSVKISNSFFFFVLLSRKSFHYVKQP